MANRKAGKKIFLLSALRVPYILLYRYSSDNRLKFAQEYPYLGRVYSYLLRFIGRKLNLPVKKCCECGIAYLPDYRTRGHQKYCPYGCVELNRRRNKQEAKSRYRKKMSAKLLASRYNHLYRERKKSGQVLELSVTNEVKEELGRRLSAQIKFLYKKLNPEVGHEELEQLEGILENLSRRLGST